MGSWAHEIRPAQNFELWSWDKTIKLTCSVRNCNEPVAFMCCYQYVTGRAGRVSRANKRRCIKHAKSFAKKHKLTFNGDPKK